MTYKLYYGKAEIWLRFFLVVMRVIYIMGIKDRSSKLFLLLKGFVKKCRIFIKKRATDFTMKELCVNMTPRGLKTGWCTGVVGKWGTQNELKWRMIVISCILVILIGTFCIITYKRSSQALTDSICSSFQDRAIDDAKLVSQTMNALKVGIEGVAAYSEITSMDWKIQEPVLVNEVKRLNVERFQVANLYGVVKSTAHYNFNIIDRDHFRQALRGVTTFSVPMISRADGQMVIVCATPIRKNGKIVGVLTAVLDPQFLIRVIKDIQIGKSGYAFVVNREGKFISHLNEKFILSQDINIFTLGKRAGYEGLADIGHEMIQRKTGTGAYKFNQVEKFGAFAPIPDTDWILTICTTKAELFHEVNKLKYIFTIFTIIIMAVVIITNIILLRYAYEHGKMKALEKGFNESSRLLKESVEIDRLRTEFFANLSHELRTPLNVILGAIQLVQLYLHGNEINKSKVSQHIKTMKQNCQRLLRLVNNLIDATKMDAGFFEIHMRNLDIVRVVGDITASVDEYTRAKGLELQFDTNVKERIMACDPDAIERIMLNLLSNAIKFSKPGGSIFVRITDTGNAVIISVKDTGIGIPKDKQELIFERFRQVDKSLTRNYEGSGIGLSLVSSLIAIHKGKISVFSEYGSGSEFLVELPIIVLPQEEEVPFASPQSPIEKIHIEFSDIYS